jgi:hypothetical protein
VIRTVCAGWPVGLPLLYLPTHCLHQVSELTEEQKAYMAEVEAAKMEAAADSVETKGPTSFFHGKADKDYQGGMVHMCVMSTGTLHWCKLCYLYFSSSSSSSSIIIIINFTLPAQAGL